MQLLHASATQCICASYTDTSLKLLALVEVGAQAKKLILSDASCPCLSLHATLPFYILSLPLIVSLLHLWK